jgi:hypothetical protein
MLSLVSKKMHLRGLSQVFILFAVALATTGCGVLNAIQARSNNANLMKLEVGMSRNQVLQLMGQPDKREAYGNSEFLIYRTPSDFFTPIAIVDGKVVGWGRNYYDNAIRSKIEADVTVR